MDKLFRWLFGVMPKPVLQPVGILAGTNQGFLFAEGAGDGTKEEEDETPPEDVDEDEPEEDDPEPDDEEGEYKNLTLEEAKRLLAAKDQRLSQVNEESAERRRKLKALEEAEEARKREALTEEERIKSDLAKAQQERDEYLAKVRRLETEKVVAKTVVMSGDKELKLIDPSDFALEEDQEVEDIPMLLEKLHKSKPHYFEPIVKDPELSPDGSPIDDKKKKKGPKPVELPKQKL